MSARVESPLSPGTDLSIEVSRGNRAWRYRGMVRRSIRPSTVSLVADELAQIDAQVPVLMLTGHASTNTADLLRRRGIQFIDTAGNAYLEAPDLLLYVVGQRPKAQDRPPKKDRVGPAAWQVAFVLMRDPDALRLSVRELGGRAGVSHGAAASALRVFGTRGWIHDEGQQGRELMDRSGLLSAWLMGFSDRLSPKLELAVATSPGSNSPSRWARRMDQKFSSKDGLLGGEAAAELGGFDLQGVTASVYVPNWNEDVMKRFRLVPSQSGAIRVRKMFAPTMHNPSDSRLVDPLIILAELSTIPDERLDGARAALRASVLKRVSDD